MEVQQYTGFCVMRSQQIGIILTKNKFGWRRDISDVVQNTESKRIVAVFNNDEKKYQKVKRFMIQDVWLPNLAKKDGRGNPTEFF